MLLCVAKKKGTKRTEPLAAITAILRGDPYLSAPGAARFGSPSENCLRKISRGQLTAMLRRGFKSEANRYAREFRLELGVPPHGPLCPWQLAKHLLVPVYDLSEFVEVGSPAAFFLSDQGLWEFSGGDIHIWKSSPHRHQRCPDPPKRQASDLSHELSHCILGHTPVPKCQAIGSRQHDPAQEEEANYLGPDVTNLGGSCPCDRASRP